MQIPLSSEDARDIVIYPTIEAVRGPVFRIWCTRCGEPIETYDDKGDRNLIELINRAAQHQHTTEE